MAGSNDKKSIRMHIEDDKTSMLFFLFLALLYSVVAMTKNCFSSALAAIVSEGIMKKSQAGLITSSFYLFYGPLQIVGGILADKHSPEKMVKIGLAGSVLANAVIFFNHNYYVMLVAWVGNGISQMALYPAMFKMVTSQLSPNWRKKGIYYFSFTGTIGLMFSYIVAAFVTKWEYNFLLSAILSLGLFVALDVIYRRVKVKMAPDETPLPMKQNDAKTKKISTIKLFATTGFLLLLPVGVLRYMIDNSIKTFTPTMMIESYHNMSITVSNLLNVFVIISGLLGMILVRKILFPKVMRNEVSVTLLLLALVLPFAFVIKFTGKIDVLMIIVAMCIASALLSGASLMNGFINGSFSKYGKNGTAAGAYNAASSIGVVLQSYGFTSIADHFGWGVVTDVYIIGTLACVVFSLCALPLWQKYKKQ